MTVTLPTTGLALWQLVPLPIRLQMRARPPMDSRITGDDHGVAVAVGKDWPLQLLFLWPADDGIRCVLGRLVAKSPTLKPVADETVPPQLLGKLLQRWAVDYLN